jgi:hypothetical protein
MKERPSTTDVPVHDPQRATRYSLRQMLGGRCCRCNQDLRGHEYQMFASTIATSELYKTLLDFFNLAKSHEWETLAKYQAFDGSKNAAVVFALRCQGGGLTALYVRDPFELFDSKSLENWDSLSEKEGQEWNLFLPKEKWITFNENQTY